jgi:hypothetical protein
MEIPLTRRHHQRLREVYRSAGWPFQDMLEVELLAAGLLERVEQPGASETLRLTDQGLQVLAGAFATNKAARSAHEALVERVALEMCRAGRLAWRGLSLRARIADANTAGESAWCLACPDVFSIRNTTIESWLEPIVHEVKVSRADLLGDLRKTSKRAAYLDLGGECWYVLGIDARGKPIARAEEIPPECGVMQAGNEGLSVLRPAPRRRLERLPLHVWMALAKATPVKGLTGDEQGLL